MFHPFPNLDPSCPTNHQATVELKHVIAAFSGSMHSLKKRGSIGELGSNKNVQIPNISTEIET